MRGLVRRKKRDWRRGVSLIAILAILSTLLPGSLWTVPGIGDVGKVAEAADPVIVVRNETGDALSGTYTMRKVTDTLEIPSTVRAAFPSGTKFNWEISGGTTDVVSFDDGSDAGQSKMEDKTSVKVKAKAFGERTITIDAVGPDATGATVILASFELKIKVEFSINESLKRSGNTAPHVLVQFAKINPKADRKALIFDMSETRDREENTTGDEQWLEVKVSDSVDYVSDQLNLLFSSGVSEPGGAGRKVEWETDDAFGDIIEVVEKENDGTYIRAKGLGHAVLKVTLKESPEDSGKSDQIDVYVKPKLSLWETKKESDGTKSEVKTAAEEFDNSNRNYAEDTSFSLDNIYISPGTQGREAQISNKLVWAIYKQDGENYPLVKDSLGNGSGQEYLEAIQDPKRMTNTEARRYYLKNSEAATYRVQFFNTDAYSTDGGEEDSEVTARYTPFAFYLNVYSDWGDKEVTVNVGGYYDLAKALKLPESYFKDGSFTVTPDGSGLANQDGHLLRAVKAGDAHFTVKRTGGTSTIKYLDEEGNPLPIAVGSEVEITLHIAPSLQISTAETTMAVNTDLSLQGIFNTGNQISNNPDLSWTYHMKDGSDAARYLTITEKEPKYMSVIHASAVTPKNNPVVVTLYWHEDNGVTQSATCEITIKTTIQTINLNPSSLSLKPGEEGTVTASGAGITGLERLVWQSSDKDLFTVETQEGFYNRAVVTAGTTKVGTGTLIVINPEDPDHAIATIPVTVTSPMTKIWISDRENGGEIANKEIWAEFTREGVQLYAPYEPQAATSTERVWRISYPFGGSGIATVDANTGYVKFLKADEEHAVRVIVEDATNPDVNDYVDIHVTTTRITAITFTEQEIHMIKGDTYQLEPKITPENPMDKTMVWESLGEAVASVDQKGLVTALAPGETYVEVHAAYNAEIKARVKVIITDRLLSIAFENVTDTVQMGKQINLNVVYNPSENVNKKVTFTSTNPGIATVNDKGVVTGIAVGDVMMIAVSEELGTSGAITCMIHVIEPVIVAEGFDIDPKEMTIKEGQTFEIMPIFTPLDPTDQTVEYTSSDETIATVSVGGIVTGVTASKKPAIITCRYVPTGDVQLCSVTVESAVTLTLSPSSKTIVKGRSFTIKKTVAPAGMNSNAVWKTDNAKVATVSAAGKVKARKVGTCNITCKLVNYKNVTAVCKVKVVKVKTTIKLNKTSIRINIGQKYTLKPTVTSNDTKTPSVTYTAINKKIASVGKSSGRVKGKKVGSTYVVATTTDSRRATAKCRVVVIHRATEVRMAKSYATCYVGTRITLKATVLPKSTSIKKLQWSSSDDTIAKVDQSGKVSALKEGEIYITAKTTDGSNKSDRCFVRVLERVPASSITVAQSKLTVKKGDTAQLSYTILPTDTTDTVKMASDNKRVATVTNGGKITAVGTGVCTVTIMTPGGITSTVEVHVVDLNKSSIRMRQYDTETLVVTGTDDSITWYSANPRVATVENGTVVGRSIGTTVVYAYVDGCTLSCRVQIVSVNS